MKNNTLIELNKRWQKYKTELENELNKNSIPFGEIQPGYIIFCPIITSYQTKFDVPQAGFIHDFFVKEENAKTPTVNYPVLIGYTACCRFAINDEAYFNRNIRYLIESIKLTLKHTSGISYNEPHHGYYIKLSDFEDYPDSACYKFTVESNVIPMIQLGRNHKTDSELRKK